ncbi:MAG TPA: baseplate J/gp47 family protein, partial [Pyrinomonadaceae bacterium]|nr:baseplate J/gp47 family protein [Pyrinomonadaceae bacterium]
EGREIRVWYASGGGAQGNVSADTLTVLKTQIAGVTVTNPTAATGGRDTETLQNALIRGPQELRSLQRAITASDFELLALHISGIVARAKAFTKAMLWRHAQPGTIEVLLVPNVPEEQRPNGAVTLEALKAQETDEARQVIRRALDERRPLGTVCLVNWVRYKKVGVSARAVIHRGADAESVKSRVLKRINQVINPLPSDLPSRGWEFGEPLRASHIYDILLAERDVSYIENVSLHLDEVPESDITSVTADFFQPNTWYSSTGARLFRTIDDGEGWELLNVFADEQIEFIRTNKIKAGMLAVITRLKDGGSRLYISADCGETWRELARTDFIINDLTWTWRNNAPLLILATDEGLYELSLQAGGSPVQILVDAQKPNLGFYAVTASIGIRGTFYIAAAARSQGGIYLSPEGGKSESFANIGLKEEEVRVLEMQVDGVQTYLWAGVRVLGSEAGKGCFRWNLQGSGMPNPPFNFQRGWGGGSCRGIAFKGSLVFAGTHEKGVLWLDTAKGEAASWHQPILESGLPIRDEERIFFPIETIASLSGQNYVFVGGRRGVFRSADNGTTYESVSQKVFSDKVTLPPTWLFCSGEHNIEVVSEK